MAELTGWEGILEPGERILWQGVPDWRLLAIQVFHVRAIAIYFAVLLGWRFERSSRRPAVLPAASPPR